MLTRPAFLAIAERNLRVNLAPSPSGEVLLAGNRQYHTLWVRDFCFAVPGLLALGWDELVERELKLIFSFRQPGLPRGIDVRNVKWRVVRNTVLRRFKFCGAWKPEDELRPEFLGEHGTPAFDSNALFLLAVGALARKRELDPAKRRELDWISPAQLWELLSFYGKYWRDGLLHQPAFSDWQDSVKRTGPILLSHLFYLAVLEAFPELPAEREAVRARILEAFYDPAIGLFREQPGRDLFCLDSHAFLLSRPKLFPSLDYSHIFSTLRGSDLWKTGPGVPAHPPYGRSERSWTTRMIGMGGYHCEFVWGWLAAEAYKLCRIFGDEREAERLFGIFAEQVERDQVFWEVYQSAGNRVIPFESMLYRSEGPFSWSAAKWVEAVSS